LRLRLIPFHLDEHRDSLRTAPQRGFGKKLESLRIQYPTILGASQEFNPADGRAIHEVFPQEWKRTACDQDRGPSLFLQMGIGAVVATLDSATATHDQACDPNHEEHDEQHLCNGGGGTRESAESESGGDQGNDEEYKGPVEHGFMGLVLRFLFAD
jgi:hypothetical protein